MAGDHIIVLGSGDIESEVGRELDQHLGGERQRRYRRFLMAALGSIPWIGGFLSAAAAAESEGAQNKINELQQEWLEEHRAKLTELAKTLIQIVERLESFGGDIRQRIESDEYLALVGRAFRTWDQADTQEKRQLIKCLLMNAGGIQLCPDDLIRDRYVPRSAFRSYP